jgi:hypothetical protein
MLPPFAETDQVTVVFLVPDTEAANDCVPPGATFGVVGLMEIEMPPAANALQTMPDRRRDLIVRLSIRMRRRQDTILSRLRRMSQRLTSCIAGGVIQAKALGTEGTVLSADKHSTSGDWRRSKTHPTLD